MSGWVKTIIFLGIAIFLTEMLPTSIFSTVDTLIHESSHALTAFLLSGQNMSIELYHDNSGVTYYETDLTWTDIPISMAGYMGSSCFAILLFYLRSKEKMRFGLQLLTIIAIAVLLFLVDNSYGVWWLSTFSLITILVLAFLPKWLSDMYYLFISFICLTQAVLSPIWLTQIAWETPAEAGDATNLADCTGVPAWVWAVIFVLFALGCAKKSIDIFLKERKQSA